MTPFRALVLGARGFVGSEVVAALTGEGWSVAGQSRVPGRAEVCLDPATAAPGEVAAVLERIRPSVVVNCAGALWPGPDGSVDLTANPAIVSGLLAATQLISGPAPAFVHIGTVYEYGESDGVVTETTPPRPLSDYARSKLAATTRATRWPGPHTVLRISTAVGPGAPVASLLGRVAHGLLAADAAEQPILWLPSIAGHRDLVDVADVADAVVAASRRPGAGIVNVAAGTTVPMVDAVGALIACSGISPEVRTVTESPDRARSAGIGVQRVDIRRAEAVLGWTPRRRLADSVARLWRDLSDARPAMDRT